VARIERVETDGFELLSASHGSFRSPRLIVATGGLALPKSGSDGWGLDAMRALGHTIVPTTPSLAPLILAAGPEPGGRFAELSGLSLRARISIHESSGRLLAAQTDSLLFTHFGLSGPGPMNLSRHIARVRLERPGASISVRFGHPNFETVAQADAWLLERIRTRPKRLPATELAELFPERLAQLFGEGLPVLGQMTREQRLRLAECMAALPLPVVGDRGYSLAECTAGGVDLREVDSRTMESRKVPGLHLCGEILDVDGRIGGFNFQWAWASGYLAGRGAAAKLDENPESRIRNTE
jgi:predicted Rossmann fold flavoprotein